MLKGIQKQMVMVRTSDSTVFETAYFVLRDGVRDDGGDIVSEAGRIVSKVLPHDKRGATQISSQGKKRGLFFVAGILCGSALSFAVTLLLRVL